MLFKELWDLVLNTETIMFHGNYMDEHILLQQIATFNKNPIIEGVRGTIVPRWDDSDLLCEIVWEIDNDKEMSRGQVIGFMEWMGRITAHSWSLEEFWYLNELNEYCK